MSAHLIQVVADCPVRSKRAQTSCAGKLVHHYSDVIVGAMACQITSLTTVYSTVYSGADQSSASLAFVRGIHRWPVNSPHKGPVTRKRFLFDDVIMIMAEMPHHSARCFGELSNMLSVWTMKKFRRVFATKSTGDRMIWWSTIRMRKTTFFSNLSDHKELLGCS